jgi:hypothetical protein
MTTITSPQKILKGILDREDENNHYHKRKRYIKLHERNRQVLKK